ncbi:MAG: NAD(P)H-dependent oxidoreductase [Acidobacteria bacterium]|nr:NAD(P)H-dependent oxidoreductase [Acidobacteriota bacterium]
MNLSILLAHPRPGSLCHQLARAAADAACAQGWTAALHDLYAERFDPVMGDAEAASRRSDDPLVERHCAEVATADGIVIVHPNWWSGPPAILKGWCDRVMRPGVAYTFSELDANKGAPVGLLRARAVLALHTGSMPRAVEEKRLGNPLELLWHKALFAPCGVTSFRQLSFAPVANATPEQCDLWLAQTREAVRGLFLSA